MHNSVPGICLEFAISVSPKESIIENLGKVSDYLNNLYLLNGTNGILGRKWELQDKVGWMTVDL